MTENQLTMAEIIYTPSPKTFLPWFATFEIEVKSSGICKQKLVSHRVMSILLAKGLILRHDRQKSYLSTHISSLRLSYHD